MSVLRAQGKTCQPWVPLSFKPSPYVPLPVRRAQRVSTAEQPAPIPVNQTYLPPRHQYDAYLDAIWESGWITNNGRLLQRLERELEAYLDVPHVRVVANGTLALQIALRALDIGGEVITTPFSYVATTTSLLWEGCTPVFVDVDPDTFMLDPARVEAALTPRRPPSSPPTSTAPPVTPRPCERWRTRTG